MNKARLDIPVSKLSGNSGQLPWLPKNPRSWTLGDINRTVKSITTDPDFLEDRPLLAVPAESGKGERYIVFAGNLRLKACKESGVKTAPVVIYFPETDEDKETVKRRAMLDNGSFGSWDFDALANEWDDLPLLDLGVPAWEAEQPEVPEAGAGAGAGGSAQEDDFDESQDEIHVLCAKGDIWQLGDHRLMCGDSIDLEQVKTLMGGGTIKADISFFSPPYNTGGIGKNLTKDNGRSKYLKGNDDMTRDQYTQFLNGAIRNAMECSRFTFCNIQLLANNKASLLDALVDNRDIFADAIVWDKGRSQPQLARNVLNSEYEFVFVFSDAATRAIGTIPFHGTLKNIVHISPGHNEFSGIHNAVYPVEFCGHFIEHFAKETVLDLFGGTGTTMVAAEQLGRKCYMMELDPHYCDVIIARWEKLTGKKAVKIAG